MEADITSQAAGLASNTDFSLLSLFLRADFIVKSVILMLIGCSIYSWAIIIEKFKLFKKINLEAEEFEAKFDASIRKYEDAMIKREMGISLSEFESQGNFFIHKLQPLKDIHLNSTYSEDLSTYGNKRFLIIFGITGLLILFIAGFNFVNLTTSRASLRAKEIGVKKILGSTRKSIILQILIEITTL